MFKEMDKRSTFLILELSVEYIWAAEWDNPTKHQSLIKGVTEEKSVTGHNVGLEEEHQRRHRQTGRVQNETCVCMRKYMA